MPETVRRMLCGNIAGSDPMPEAVRRMLCGNSAGMWSKQSVCNAFPTSFRPNET